MIVVALWHYVDTYAFWGCSLLPRIYWLVWWLKTSTTGRYKALAQQAPKAVAQSPWSSICSGQYRQRFQVFSVGQAMTVMAVRLTSVTNNWGHSYLFFSHVENCSLRGVSWWYVWLIITLTLMALTLDGCEIAMEQDLQCKVALEARSGAQANVQWNQLQVVEVSWNWWEVVASVWSDTVGASPSPKGIWQQWLLVAYFRAKAVLSSA